MIITGLSAASIGGRIGGIVAPFVIIAQSTAPWLPNAIFGSAIIFGGLFCFLLPETTGADMPQTLEDANEFYANHGRRKRQHEETEEIGLIVPQQYVTGELEIEYLGANNSFF